VAARRLTAEPLANAGFARIHGLPDDEGEVRALEAVAQ